MPFNWGAFLGGYAQGRERSLARKEQEEERKLKERMYKDNLRLQEMTANRQQQIFDRQQQSYDREAQGREQISAAVGAGPGDMLGQRPQGVEGPTGPEGGFYSFSPERQQMEVKQGLAKSLPVGQLDNAFAQSGSANRAPFSVTDRTYFDARAQGATHEQALEMAAKARLALSTASAQAPFDVRANPQNQAIQQQYNFGTGAARGAGTVAGTVGQQLGQPIQPMQPLPGMPQVQGGPSPMPQTPQVAPGPAPMQPMPSVPPAPQAGGSDYLRLQRERAKTTKEGSEAGEAKTVQTGLADAMSIVQELDDLSAGLFTKKGAGAAAIQGLQRGVESFSPATQAGMYEDRKKNLAEKLSRNFGGVKGTATEGDINRMVAGLPRPGDSASSRAYKINAIKSLMQIAYENQQRLRDGSEPDLNAARTAFSGLVTQFLSGKYVPGQPAQGAPAQTERKLRFNPQTGKIE